MPANPKVNPCLFIGLGTTGLSIIEDLRRLFNEEFGVSGLPCFRYLVLETDKKKEADNKFLAHPPAEHENINLIPITIHDVEAIKVTPEMRDWLDERLIKRGDKSYQSGAGAFRQAGRLCLWENWPKVREAIQQALGAIRYPEADRKTDRFLREEYLPRKHAVVDLPRESLVESNLRVYLCGTLCGGTCSGAFLDVAYYLWQRLDAKWRSNLKVMPTSEVVGLFTLPDTSRLGEENARERVANTWAALRELDFYYSDKSYYRSRLPGESRIETRDQPFDTLYLVSMVNQARQGFTTDDRGERGLTFMCAMNLFTEVVAGMAATKSEIRADFRRATDYLRANPQGHIRAFSSFGLSAIWYPRYRIATAINRRLGEEMGSHWLGATQGLNVVTIDETATGLWEALRATARNGLLGEGEDAPYSPGLPSLIQQMITEAGSRIRGVDIAGLQRFVEQFPGSAATLAHLLGPGGDFHGKIANCRALVADRVRQALEGYLVEYLRQHTFAETGRLLNRLAECAAAELNEPAAELPVFKPQLDFGLAADVDRDLATRLLGRRPAALLEYKEALWASFARQVLAHLELVAKHYLKWVIGEVQQSLFRLRTECNALRGRLDMLVARCQTDRERAQALSSHPNIITVFAGQRQDIAEDVQRGFEEILQQHPAVRLREAFLREDGGEQANPFELLRQDLDQLLERIDRGFDAHSQGIVAPFSLGKTVLTRFQYSNARLVNACQPYFEPTTRYTPMPVNRPTNLLFAQDQDTADALSEAAGAHIVGTRFSPKVTPLAHFAFFYQEHPGIAISDLAIAERSSEILADAEQSAADQPTHHTHKQGSAAFNAAAVAEFDAARKAISEALELGQKYFLRRNEKVFVEYRGASGQTRTLFLEEDEAVRRFVKEQGLPTLQTTLDATLGRIPRAELLQTMEARKQETPEGQWDELEQRYERLLQRLFPDAA